MDQNYRDLSPEAFPEIGGIRLFVPRPQAALQAFLTDLSAVEERFASAAARLEQAAPGLPNSLRRRAERMQAGMAHDVAVMKRACEPIDAAVAGQPPREDFIAWASVQTGLSLHDMFIYFYQDWTPTEQFERVKATFRHAVSEHCRERASVAVLGAGACGLVHALAHDFQHTYAVDLSLPTLLLAKRFFEGERLSLHLEKANWNRAELAPPPPAPTPISFLAANVTHLPFRDDRLSCVVTQCLFDIVDNPVHLAEEIQRVLAPGGVWINFSHAFAAPGDPIELGARKLEEVPLVLGPLGFDVLSLQRKRFIMLDPSAIDPEPARTEDDVHFFLMSKAVDRAKLTRFSELRARFEANDPSLWRIRPRPVPGKEVSISERKSFGAEGSERFTELKVGPYGMPIPASHADLLAVVLEQVDGRRTLGEMYEVLEESGAAPSRAEFLELAFCLSVERYLWDLGA
jgi:SAM-dependent methyltransferase